MLLVRRVGFLRSFLDLTKNICDVMNLIAGQISIGLKFGLEQCTRKDNLCGQDLKGRFHRWMLAIGHIYRRWQWVGFTWDLARPTPISAGFSGGFLDLGRIWILLFYPVLPHSTHLFIEGINKTHVDHSFFWWCGI